MRWLYGLLIVLLVSVAAHAQDGPEMFAGTVLDADGQPVAGAAVWLTTEGWVGQTQPSVLAQTETDAEGRFEFGDFPPPPTHSGAYNICAHKQGYAFAWTNRLRRDDAALRLVLEPAALLPGTVLDPQGDPVAGIRPQVSFLVRQPGFDPLAISGYGSSSVLAPAPELSELMVSASDAAGQFALRHLPAGVDVTLKVEQEGYASQRISRHWAQLMSGEPIEVRLEKPGAIRGRVYRAEDDAPVPGVKVCAKWFGGTAAADDQGRYEITGLSAGVYQVYLRELPVEFTAAAVENVTVEPGGVVEGIDLKVIPGFEITGTVTDKDTGKPIADAGICCNTAQQPKAGISWPLVRTGADGRYCLRAPAGRARVRPLGVPPGWRPTEEPGRDTRRFTVSAEGAPYKHDFQLARGRSFSGTVLGPDGKPARYATVLMCAGGGFSFVHSSTADAEGRFENSNADPNATYVLNAHLGDSMTLEDTLFGPEDEGPVALQLSAGARPTLTGRVIGADNTPAPYAIVRVDFQGHRDFGRDPMALTVRGNRWFFISNAIADGQGRFRLRALWPGMLSELRVRAAGYSEQNRQLEELQPGEQRDLGDVILPVADVVISGIALDEKDQPVPGVMVDVQRRAGVFSRRFMARTDLQGRFRFEGLPREDMTVVADQFEADCIPVEVGPGSQEIVLRVMRRDDQMLYLHTFNPPLAKQTPGLKATLTEIYRFKTFTPTGQIEQYLGMGLTAEMPPEDRYYAQASVFDDQGRLLQRQRVRARVAGSGHRAYDLPEAGVKALSRIVVGQEPGKQLSQGPIEFALLRLQATVGQALPIVALWALELTDEWIEVTGADASVEPKGGPYLSARLYILCPWECRYRVTSAAAVADGPELVPKASFEYYPGIENMGIPDSLQDKQELLAEEADVALKLMKLWSERPPAEPIVQGQWLQSVGGHGAIALPEAISVTIEPYGVPVRPTVIFENIALPPELTKAVDF